MSEDEDDLQLPPFTFEDMKRRFQPLISDLTRAKESADKTENLDDMKAFRDAFGTIMKVFHDCRHRDRGFVRQSAPVEHLRWFVSAVDTTLEQFRRLQLDTTDEYSDLRCERHVVSSFLSAGDPIPEETIAVSQSNNEFTCC